MRKEEMLECEERGGCVRWLTRRLGEHGLGCET